MRRWLKRGADAVGGGLFVLLFLVFLVQITARFGFNQPLPWTDELAVVLYVWVILWSTAFVVPQREHVAFDLVYNAMPAGVRRVFRGLAALLFGGLALWALPASWDYIRFMAREGTPVLGLPFMAVFMPFAFMLASVVARSAFTLWRLARGLDHELSGEVKP
ncbi:MULTISPECIES: TRAP transporter small permease [unclassified Rhizobacter]|uniref:TRAP transporter small permease n=1 Tax=unclassified Rhizobacter TaxID=2640088 RepID=UPI0007015A40|nr:MULTISPECIES: TRAP transporter small permease [unclassified Rhizobacter]KQU78255.1 C4-dicarboxylate ABC transporter permease [Rhizobacter sp. Root29]KQW16001.1 C4-dicarboxylate ABC transporter permease [Rhizobacter sp. Root1238]KRB25119.1 C4-dicarboxylate ABC transporter permease [Rhizobacter sp. Root16D2]